MCLELFKVAEQGDHFAKDGKPSDLDIDDAYELAKDDVSGIDRPNSTRRRLRPSTAFRSVPTSSGS